MKPSKVFTYSGAASILLVAYLFDHSTTPALVASTWLVATLLFLLCCVLAFAQYVYNMERTARTSGHTLTVHYPYVAAFRKRAGM
jgi:hypothetical protein